MLYILLKGHGGGYFIFARSKSNLNSFPSGEVTNKVMFEFGPMSSLGNLNTHPATNDGEFG